MDSGLPPPSFLPTAARWVFAHMAGMFLGWWAMSWLSASLSFESPGLELSCAAMGLHLALTHVLALRWIRAPLRLQPWGGVTWVGYAAGADLAIRTYMTIIFQGRLALELDSTLITVLAAVASLFTLGACLALPQAILLHRKFGRAMAIRWGAWTAAACIAGWLIVASELPEILGWEDLDSSLDGSLDQALLGLVFSALTCPALKRLLAAKAISR